MESFIQLRKTINDLLGELLPGGEKSEILRKVEDELLSVHLKFDNQVRSLNDDLRSKSDTLLTRGDELCLLMKQNMDLYKELTITKESAASVIKCLNISLKSSCNVIARSIIEMIMQGAFARICSDVELLTSTFRREMNYSTRGRTTSDLIVDAQARICWKKLTNEQQEDAQLFCKWQGQQLRQNVLPTRDLLRRMWRRSKSSSIVTTIAHPKFGNLCERSEVIENAFTNLYQTLSDNVHNSNLAFEDEVLPIPDLNGNTFRKADALALATFYSIAMPNMRYEIITNVVSLPLNAGTWLSDSQNTIHVVATTTNTVVGEHEETPLKRKFQSEQENDAQKQTAKKT